MLHLTPSTVGRAALVACLTLGLSPRTFAQGPSAPADAGGTGASRDEVAALRDEAADLRQQRQALAVLRDWSAFDLYFVEAPLWPDDLAGYRRLVEEQPIPIATGEWLATRHEFAQLIDAARPQVVQPDVGRVGGLLESLHVCDLASASGLSVVPHLWKTGISIAAAAHLAAARPEVTFIEYLPPALCESGLRRDLTSEELQMIDGRIATPAMPGLGIELDREALAHYRVD